MTRKDFLNSLRPGMALLMRGAPGSGKSTLAESVKAFCKTQQWTQTGEAHIPWVGISSADTFRMVDGQYVFKPEENGLVHGKCLRDFITNCTAYVPKYDVIVCDNTNIRVFEMAPYIAIAAAYGWEPLIVNVSCDPAAAAARNLHGVPATNVQRMASQAARAKLPPHWRQIIVNQE